MAESKAVGMCIVPDTDVVTFLAVLLYLFKF